MFNLVIVLCCFVHVCFVLCIFDNARVYIHPFIVVITQKMRTKVKEAVRHFYVLFSLNHAHSCVETKDYSVAYFSCILQ